MRCYVGQMIPFKNMKFPFKFAYRRSSPYSRTFEVTSESKGFVANGFYSGMNIIEQFFASTNGRVDIVQKAVATAKSGDQGRKAVKLLECYIITNNGFVARTAQD